MEGRALYLGQRFHAASKDLVVAQEQLAKKNDLIRQKSEFRFRLRWKLQKASKDA